MKKILYSLIFILLFATEGFSQFPNFQQFGSPTTRTFFPGAAHAAKGLITGVYPDTATANLGYIDYYPGAIIQTGNQFWFRSSDAKRWIPFGNVNSNTSTVTTTISNDSTLIICNAAGSCDTITIGGTIGNYYFLNDSTVVVCDTGSVVCQNDSCYTEVSCDTVNIQPVIGLQVYQNGLRQIAPGIRELGLDYTGFEEISGNPGPASSWFRHNTQINTAGAYLTISGFPVWRPVTQFEQRQTFGISSMIGTFLSSGSGITSALDYNNRVRFGINYTGNLYGSGNTPALSRGYMEDKIGYWVGTNVSSAGSYGLRVDDQYSKFSGMFMHTKDTTNDYVLTFFGNRPPLKGIFGNLNVSGDNLEQTKIMSLRYNKDIQFHGYLNTRDDGPNPQTGYGFYADAQGNIKYGMIGSGGGGGGDVLTNLGTGYNVGFQNTNFLRRLNMGYGMLADSGAVANSLRLSVDTSTSVTGIATQGDIYRYVSVATPPIANLGSAFRLWKPQTPGLGTLRYSNGLTGDSAVSGEIRAKLGGALTDNTIINGASYTKSLTFEELNGVYIDYFLDVNGIKIWRGSGALRSLFITSDPGTEASVNSGTDNTVIGYGALKNNNGAFANVAIGTRALNANTNGSDNVAIGSDALWGPTSMDHTVAIGREAMVSATNGTDNVGIGFQSGVFMTGNQNVAVGAYSLYSNNGSTSIGFNTAIGDHAMNSNTTGNGNVAVGTNALLSNTTGLKNTALGSGAAENITTGSWNTALGQDAMLTVTDGIRNIAIGWNSGKIIHGNQNVSIGYLAGASVTGYSSNNTFIGGFQTGNNALQATTVHNSIALGSGAYTTASNQMVLGSDSISDTRIFGLNRVTSATWISSFDSATKKVSFIRASDLGVGGSGSSWATTGNAGLDTTNFLGNTDDKWLTFKTNNVIAGRVRRFGSTYFGYQAGLHDVLDSTDNVGIGTRALFNANSGFGGTTGGASVAIGYEALYSQSTNSGGNNIGIGWKAGHETTTGYSNVFLGLASGYGNTTGLGNVAVGSYTGNALKDGYSNIFIGQRAGQNNTNGFINTFIGRESGNRASGQVGSIAVTAGGSGYTTATVTIAAPDATNVGGLSGGDVQATATANISGGAITSITITNKGLRYSSNPLVTITGDGTGATATATVIVPEGNVGLGAYALFQLEAGDNNTAIGRHAGYGNGGNESSLYDSLNSFFGAYSGRSNSLPQSTILNKSTAIGYNAKVYGNKQIVLGATGADQPNVGIGTENPDRMLTVMGYGRFTDTLKANVVYADTKILTIANNRYSLWDMYDSSRTIEGQIYYDHFNNQMAFNNKNAGGGFVNIVNAIAVAGLDSNGSHAKNGRFGKTGYADPSAVVDMDHTAKGFLKPRMNTTQMNAIASPATGLEIFNTDSVKTFFYNGSVWTTHGGGGGGGGSISLTTIGSTPNANGATLTGSVLNLEPASASFGGVVTTGTQSFAGDKTFASGTTTITGTNPTALSITTTNVGGIGGYFPISTLYATSATGGNIIQYIAGKTGSTNDAYSLDFHYNGPASTSNYLGLGFYGNNDIFRIDAAGNVGVGSILPSYKFTVDGTSFFVGQPQFEAQLKLKDISAPSTPASNYGNVYVENDSMRFKNDGGEVFTLGAARYATYTDTTDKTFSAATTAEVIPLNNEDIENGIQHSGSSEEITFSTAGVYSFNYYANAQSSASDAVKICMQKWNGSSWDNVPYSAILINISVTGTFSGSGQFQVNLAVADKVRFVASASSTSCTLNHITNSDGVAATPAFRVTINKL